MYIYMDVYMAVSCSNCLPLFFLSCVCVCVCACEDDLLEVSDYLLPGQGSDPRSGSSARTQPHPIEEDERLRHVSVVTVSPYSSCPVCVCVCVCVCVG